MTENARKMQRVTRKRYGAAKVIEDPPGSNHYRVTDTGGWLEDGRTYSYKELQLLCDAMNIEYGERTGGWCIEE